MSRTVSLQPDTVLRGHEDSINSLSFISESHLSSGSGDGVVKLWNLRDRRPSSSRICHNHSILSISSFFNGSSVTLVTCGRDGFIHLWDVSNDIFNKSYSSFNCGVNHFCGCATDVRLFDSNVIVSPSRIETQILVWDIRSPNAVTTINETDRFVSSHSESGKLGMVTSLLYDSYGPAVSLNGPHSSPESSQIGAAPPEEVKAPLIFSNQGPVIYAGYESGDICGIDLRVCKIFGSYRAHSEPVMCMDLAVKGAVSREATDTAENDANGEASVPSGHMAADAEMERNGDPKVAVDDGASETLPSPVSQPARCPPSRSRMSTTTMLVSGSAGENVARAVLTGASPVTPSPLALHPVTSRTIPAAGVGAVRCRGDGKLVVAGCWDHTVRVFENNSKLKPLAVLRYHRESVYAVAFGRGRSEGIFATGSKDCTIAIWSLYAPPAHH